MSGSSRPPSRLSRPAGKSPAERSAEFDAKQATLKEEAAQRREAAKAAADGDKKGKKKS